jgi:hypothetical protein
MLKGANKKLIPPGKKLLTLSAGRLGKKLLAGMSLRRLGPVSKNK